MSTLATFDSTKEMLSDILRAIAEGKVQLPDFQRGWVWDDERIQSLLGSIAKAFPIGTLMMLETGNEEVRFKPRLVEGVDLPNPPPPERFILDGQQRLTALFQALKCNEPVQTKDSRGKPIRRWYYMDIARALEPGADLESAIVGLPEDRKVRNFRGEVIEDVSTRELEYEKGLFPMRCVLDSSDWRTAYQDYWRYDPAKVREFNEFEKAVIKKFEQYQVPVIVLRKETKKEAVCQVFEKVNTGGVALTVFELLTATYAADDFNLRQDWEGRKATMAQDAVLKELENTDFLQAVTLLSTYDARKAALAVGEDPRRAPGVSCKREEILRLPLDRYRRWADVATDGFRRAAKMLFEQRVFAVRDLPYRTQLVPLAAILGVLGNEVEKAGVRDRILRWYWCGVFGELYGAGIESRFARDLPEVVDWVRGGPEPSTVAEANFMPERLLSLHTRNSAAYKGLYVLVLKHGAVDFRSGAPIDVRAYYDEAVDIHHVFPQEWCRRQGIDSTLYDSIVNKTAVSARTNRIIGGKSPAEYLERLQASAQISADKMDSILESHLITPQFVRQNDFQGFFQDRSNRLVRMIEAAMGKPVMVNAPPGNQ